MSSNTESGNGVGVGADATNDYSREDHKSLASDTASAQRTTSGSKETSAAGTDSTATKGDSTPRSETTGTPSTGNAGTTEASSTPASSTAAGSEAGSTAAPTEPEGGLPEQKHAGKGSSLQSTLESRIESLNHDRLQSVLDQTTIKDLPLVTRSLA